VDDENGEEHVIVDGINEIDLMMAEVKPVTGSDGRPVIYSAEDDFPGANVPFAVDYMTNYDTEEEGRNVIFILRDWQRFIDANAEHVDRQLALYENIILGGGRTVVLLCPSRWTGENIPVELNSHVRLIRYDLPDKENRMAIIEDERQTLSTATHVSHDFAKAFKTITETDIEAYADACAGMTRQQIIDTLIMCAATHFKWDIDFVLDEKRKAVEQAGFTLIRPSAGFEIIGGLTPLKRWVQLISRRFTNAAKDYGFIRNIRGLLMAGVPGCGKTLVAKSMANEMNMNILMVEAQNLKGSLVGESEAKVHKLLEIARAAAPLIVFVDEAEKLLGKSEGVHDGGAHDAILGQFLTFMQEDDSGVFFVFTANNMNKFSPELVDRFEGRFFIDLPEPEEREEIIKIHLKLRSQDVDKYDVPDLVKRTAKFSGRNIEDGIEEAMTVSFSEDRPLEMQDLVDVFTVLVPTSKTKKDEIEHMRSFVENGTMRKANNVVVRAKTQKQSRIRDF
jgi:SpoVK/Ycf46/Vps4 family AAA+-type ATPase